MLIHVRLLQYAAKTFTYSVPQKLQSQIAVGIFVQVPLGSRIVPAIVHAFASNKVVYNFAIKEIVSLYPFPADTMYRDFITRVSSYCQIDSLSLYKRVQKFLEEQEKDVKHIVVDSQVQQVSDMVKLTKNQNQIYRSIADSVIDTRYETSLIHGVTGSGKTEIYKKLAQDALKQGNSVMLLLPEVSLALRFEAIFKQTFKDFLVIGFHSATTITQKRTLWKSLVNKQPVMIIGVHLPVLLPVANLGLIIVDEEHDNGYQEKKYPKLHSKDMAVLKASMYNVPIVLGSATPSLQSLWNVKQRGWKLYSLHERYAGKFPTVEVVSLKEKEKRDYFWITKKLQQEIQHCLSKKEQVILFLNRRGYSFFVQCMCSFVFSCAACSVSLTLHENQYLVCHYCGHQEILPQDCPDCLAPAKKFVKKGIGTQQLVQVLQKLFPQANIARADADTTIKKRTWQQTVEQMLEGSIDILVGTQSIAKGYHFPQVTLVGVLWADLNLHFPIYNAVESTLQQLIQVAGRAGRQSDYSKVIIQTFDQHDIYNYIDEQKYTNFYEKEIEKRKLAAYPPCSHIAEIEIRNKNQQIVEYDAQSVAAMLEQVIAQQNFDIQLLGPIAAIVYKVKGAFSQKILLKSKSRATLIQTFQQITITDLQSNLFFTIDPVG